MDSTQQKKRLPPTRALSCPQAAPQEKDAIYDIPKPTLPSKQNRNAALAPTTGTIVDSTQQKERLPPTRALSCPPAVLPQEEDFSYDYIICSAPYFQQQLKQFVAQIPPLPQKGRRTSGDSAYGSLESLAYPKGTSDVLVDNGKQLSDLFSTRHITPRPTEVVVFPVGLDGPGTAPRRPPPVMPKPVRFLKHRLGSGSDSNFSDSLAASPNGAPVTRSSTTVDASPYDVPVTRSSTTVAASPNGVPLTRSGSTSHYDVPVTRSGSTSHYDVPVTRSGSTVPVTRSGSTASPIDAPVLESIWAQTPPTRSMRPKPPTKPKPLGILVSSPKSSDSSAASPYVVPPPYYTTQARRQRSIPSDTASPYQMPPASRLISTETESPYQTPPAPRPISTETESPYQTPPAPRLISTETESPYQTPPAPRPISTKTESETSLPPPFPNKKQTNMRLSDNSVGSLDDDVFEDAPTLEKVAQQGSPTVVRSPAKHKPQVAPKPVGYVRQLFNGVDCPQGRHNVRQLEATDVVDGLGSHNGPPVDTEVVLRRPVVPADPTYVNVVLGQPSDQADTPDANTSADTVDGSPAPVSIDPVVIRVDGTPAPVPIGPVVIRVNGTPLSIPIDPVIRLNGNPILPGKIPSQFQRGESRRAIVNNVNSLEFRKPAGWKQQGAGWEQVEPVKKEPKKRWQRVLQTINMWKPKTD